MYKPTFGLFSIFYFDKQLFETAMCSTTVMMFAGSIFVLLKIQHINFLTNAIFLRVFYLFYFEITFKQRQLPQHIT